jgi:hypothetical protein
MAANNMHIPPLYLMVNQLKLSMRKKHLGNLIGNNITKPIIQKATNDFTRRVNEVMASFKCVETDTK